MNGELFDLPGNGRPKRIFKACGQVGKGKAAKFRYVWVQASTEAIAKRVGKTWLRDVHRAAFTHVIPHTSAEYAEVLRRAGFTITTP